MPKLDKTDPHPNLPRGGGIARRFEPTGDEYLDGLLEKLPEPDPVESLELPEALLRQQLRDGNKAARAELDRRGGVEPIKLEKVNGHRTTPTAQSDTESKRDRARAALRSRGQEVGSVSQENRAKADRGQESCGLSEPTSSSEIPGAAVLSLELPQLSPAKRRPGRPVAPKPWLEAGVSRMTWYRRKKRAKP